MKGPLPMDDVFQDSGGGPALRQDLGLLEDGGRRLHLFVRRVAMLSEDAADEDTEPSAHVLPQGPVDGDVAADRLE